MEGHIKLSIFIHSLQFWQFFPVFIDHSPLWPFLDRFSPFFYRFWQNWLFWTFFVQKYPSFQLIIFINSSYFWKSSPYFGNFWPLWTFFFQFHAFFYHSWPSSTNFYNFGPFLFNLISFTFFQIIKFYRFWECLHNFWQLSIIIDPSWLFLFQFITNFCQL